LPAEAGTRAAQIIMASTSRNVLANYFGQAWTVALGFAFVPFYVATLGTEGYGVVGFFLLAQAWLPLLDLGLLPAVNREFARFSAGAHDGQSIRDLLRSIELLCLVPALVIVLSALFGSRMIADHWLNVATLPLGVVALAIIMIAVVIGLRLFEGLYRGALLGASLQMEYNVAMVALGTLRHLGAVAVLKFISPTVSAFFIWQALVSLLTVLALGAVAYRYLRPHAGHGRFSRRAVAAVWGFASTSALATLLGIVLSQTDKVLLSRLLPLASFGVFTLALTACSVLPMLLNPICTAVYPRLVEYATRKSDVELSLIYHRSSQLLAVLVIPMALTLAFFSFDIMLAWTGNVGIATPASLILSAYVIGSMFGAMVQLPAYLQLAHGWTTLTAGLNVVAVAVLIPLLLLTVPRYGVIAAAIIWALLNLGYLIFMVGIMHRRLLVGEKSRWYGRAVVAPLLAALVVVGACWLLLHDAVHRWGRPGMAMVLLILAAAMAASAAVTEIGPMMLRRLKQRRGLLGGGAEG